MAGLSEQERESLTKVVARRIGTRGDAATITAAYLAAAQRHAYARTMGPGPVPTSLTVERSAFLVEISRELGRVVDDFEIEALFRVPRSQARTMRTTLLATYGDITDDLIVDWSLKGAHLRARRKGDEFTGSEIRFATEQHRDAFATQMERTGVPVEVIYGEEKVPWLAIVGDEFPRSRLPAKK